MEIIVVSDTHNNAKALEKILEISKNADVIFHLGDNIADARLLEKDFHGVVHMVKGNCDYGDDGLNEKLVELEGKKFFLTHGDRYGVNYGLDKIYYRGLELGADCILYGHTHRKLHILEGEVHIINPGSLPLPRDNSSSYSKIILDKNSNINVKLIEL
ncbi:MAG: YfcE family phosphodiesterase [Sarcina sp.]